MHTKQSSAAGSAMHGLALEIRSKRTLAIRTVQQCTIPVRAEGTRKHTNVTEHTLEDSSGNNEMVRSRKRTSNGLSRIFDILYYTDNGESEGKQQN